MPCNHSGLCVDIAGPVDQSVAIAERSHHDPRDHDDEQPDIFTTSKYLHDVQLIAIEYGQDLVTQHGEEQEEQNPQSTAM